MEPFPLERLQHTLDMFSSDMTELVNRIQPPTQRERIATAMAQGFLSSDLGLKGIRAAAQGGRMDEAGTLAELAVAHADALIAELAKERGNAQT